MVHSRGRGLNPTQAPLAHYPIPIHRHFGVPTEDIGVEKLLGNPLLPGIDNLSIRSHGRDLLDVSHFDWIAQYDSHGQMASWRGSWENG